MIILCFAVGWSTSVVAQGNPWNNPIVSPRVDTGGEVTFSVSAPSASRVELSGQFLWKAHARCGKELMECGA